MSGNIFEELAPDPVAAQNYDNVKTLFRDMRRAAERYGVERLARDLHMADDVDRLEAVLAGRLDITFGEMQVLAIALDVCVNFTVLDRASYYLAPSSDNIDQLAIELTNAHARKVWAAAQDSEPVVDRTASRIQQSRLAKVS